MTTIATMADEETPSAAAPAPTADEAPDRDSGAAGRGTAAPRSLVISVPAAVTAAMVAGMFGLLFLSLNGLRGDIDSLRGNISSLQENMNNRFDAVNNRIDAQVDRLDSRIDSTNERLDNQFDSLRSTMEEGFSEVHAILLDHTDRLARIETHLDIRPGTGAANP